MSKKVQHMIEGRTSYIVAQRQYVCCECGGHIKPLDVYQHTSGRWEHSGKVRYFRTCDKCNEIREWLCFETDWQGIEGTPCSWLFRHLRQHLFDQAKNGDPAYRFGALRRAIEMKHRKEKARGHR